MIKIASFKPKNTALTLLALACILLFVSLGRWQLHRGQEKSALLHVFDARRNAAPLEAVALSTHRDLRFYQATLTGQFDNAHTFLLDNKIQHGQVGYEVYTLFKAHGLVLPLFVDRGFVPMGRSRDILPFIKPITGKCRITGLLNVPPRYVAFGKMMSRRLDPADKPRDDRARDDRTRDDGIQTTSPIRIEYLSLPQMADHLASPIFPYLLSLPQGDARAYAVQWSIVTMGPEKHYGYALQWFAFALTLLIISVALNCRSKKNPSS